MEHSQHSKWYMACGRRLLVCTAGAYLFLSVTACTTVTQPVPEHGADTLVFAKLEVDMGRGSASLPEDMQIHLVNESGDSGIMLEAVIPHNRYNYRGIAQAFLRVKDGLAFGRLESAGTYEVESISFVVRRKVETGTETRLEPSGYSVRVVEEAVYTHVVATYRYRIANEMRFEVVPGVVNNLGIVHLDLPAEFIDRTTNDAAVHAPRLLIIEDGHARLGKAQTDIAGLPVEATWLDDYEGAHRYFRRSFVLNRWRNHEWVDQPIEGK